MVNKKDNYYMNYALEISPQANCIKGKVGAILVKENKIIAEGVNSVPNGIKPCTEESKVLTFLVYLRQRYIIYLHLYHHRSL